MTAPEDAAQHAQSDEQPPAFASWRTLYLGALVTLALVIVLIAAFSGWAF